MGRQAASRADGFESERLRKTNALLLFRRGQGSASRSMYHIVKLQTAAPQMPNMTRWKWHDFKKMFLMESKFQADWTKKRYRGAMRVDKHFHEP